MMRLQSIEENQSKMLQHLRQLVEKATPPESEDILFEPFTDLTELLEFAKKLEDQATYRNVVSILVSTSPRWNMYYTAPSETILINFR